MCCSYITRRLRAPLNKALKIATELISCEIGIRRHLAEKRHLGVKNQAPFTHLILNDFSLKVRLNEALWTVLSAD